MLRLDVCTKSIALLTFAFLPWQADHLSLMAVDLVPDTAMPRCLCARLLDQVHRTRSSRNIDWTLVLSLPALVDIRRPIELYPCRNGKMVGMDLLPMNERSV